MTSDDEVKEYESYYSDILWIDDMDTSQGSLYNRKDKCRHQKQKIDFLKDWMPNSYLYIDLIKDMSQAISIITENCSKYNLVIFDMDMRKGFSYKDHKKICEDFRNYNIMCTDEKDGSGNDVMSKIAGVYLYLLLLTMGYPADRMIIYTGNLNDDLNKYLKEYSQILVFNNNLIIEKDQEHKIDIEIYYDENEVTSKKNSYYRIRRLVQQGCHYWKDVLNTIKASTEKKIAFNEIYFSNNNNTINRISAENFLELLDRVEMMFPVIPPKFPEQVYYQAARILCEYHENNAAIQRLDEELYVFHLVCRSFRNWSAHNKFAKAEMPAEIFAIVFCIALRTYFDKKQNNEKTFDSTLNYYEEIYFTEKDISEKDYNDAYEDIHNKLTKISLVGFFKKPVYTHKYSHLVHIWGEETKKAELKDILMPIIVKDLDIWPNDINLSNLSLNSLFDLHIPQLENQNDAYQSDENKFIDLVIKKSIELWSKKSVETIQEGSS